MSSHSSFRWRGLVVAGVTLGLLVSFPMFGQEPDADEAKEKAIIERFVTVLEKNPRRGTALDKIYGYHVERGSLEGFIKTSREKAAKADKVEAAGAWMIVGLLESLRGQDAASVEAFGKAESLDPASYLASYYLGQSLVLVGQPDKAAEALERATQRKPAQADQLDVYQALGRVYQRAQKSDKALDVWNRLEKQFPNDARVQEQIATTLLEEGEFAAALPRFENLAKISKDKYRQSLFQMEAAEIKVRLGKGDAAKAEFEKLLGQLNPDNWLFREVRRRIENIYLRTDDQAGLIAYYEAWLKKNPEDLEAISRLSRLLAGLGRGPEAQSWLEKALKAAPTKKDLRHALISQLMYEQKYVEVIAQYEQLDKHEPNNPDTLRDWGRVILEDTARDEATRKKDAAAVWRRLTAAKPRDPLVASQVAELFRSVEMTDEALELYQKAMALAPEASQYKEYLGEYFHSLKRKDEAMATWRQMAAGKANTAANVARLAEVLSGFGYLAEAVETNAEACKLDPKEINLQIKQVDLLSQADKHEDALKQLDVVKKLAANDEEREAWLGRELKELQAMGKLKERIAELSKELAGQGDKGNGGLGDKEKAALAERWFWLARAQESERALKEAAQAVTNASNLVPQSIPILMSSARILEAQNNLLAAVEVNTKLAAVDRRYRTEYLKKVAQLEMALGRRDKAIQAGRDLIASAPGNPELYEFFSQLCFGIGEAEEGLQALRRSVRVNPTEPKGLLLLAGALSEQFRTSEAIELYWRAFDKAGNLEDRLGVVPKLTELYLQTNQFDRLLERLERQRREPNQQREMTICLAQAYQSAGDDGNARTELEKLLTDDTRDTQLLTQLVKLCESDGDLDVAVRYQQQLNKSSPGKEGTMRLAGLLMKAGEKDEATALMAQLTENEKDPEVVLKSIDSLLTQKQFEQALTLVEKLVRDQPKNWELLYREGAALAKSKPEEAAQRFEAILALKLKDDEPSLAAKSAAKKAAKPARGQVAMNPFAMQQQQQHSLQHRIEHVHTIRQAVKLDGEEYYGGGFGGGQPQQPFWSPFDYGQARMAAFAWQMAFAQTGGKLDEFLKSKQDAAKEATSRNELIDWYYFASLKHDGKEQYRVLKQLSLRPDADREVKQMYLYSLSQRGPAEGDAANAEADPSDATETTEVMDEDGFGNGNRVKLAPLDKDELEHVIAIAKEAASLTELDQHNWSVGTSLELIAGELKRSGRKDEAEKMYADALAGAKEPGEIATVLQGTVQRGDFDTALKLLDRLTELIAKQGTQPTPTASGNFNYTQYVSTPQYQSQLLSQLMSVRVRANQKAKKENLLDGVFPLWERYLKLVAARNVAPVAQTAAAKKARAANPYVSPGYYYVWRINGQQLGEQVDFPQQNDICDHATIQMLRQMFALYRETEQGPALTEAFAAALRDPQTPAAQRQLWQFGLGYLHWWNDEKDEALAVLSDAIQKVPENTEFKFELARLHEKRREFSEALALIDALTPSDQAELQKREVMALRLAVNSGDIDRARAAADRLFGLRLDSTLQMALARQMHQLGMHEQAEAVLARAGRQAGNKTDVLGGLMEQYASTGKNEVAVQIAHQLLRRSKPSSNAGQMQHQRNNDGTDPTRTQALQVLNRSGKLPEMIAKVESQLKKSPKSQRLLETLLEYHVAAGNDKQVEELNAKLSESKIDNPAFRYQLALKLLDAGKTKEANEHLKVVFEKEPRLAMNNYWELENKYNQHNKSEDLAALYESIDLKVFRQNTHIITNAIGNMMRREQTKDRALKLFKKAWKDLPDSRSEMLGYMHDEAFWKLPEIYDYARQGVIPSELNVQNNRFQGFGNSYSYSEDGKITTLYSRVLDMSVAQKKLDPLGEEVAAAVKKMPAWAGGKALLAMIELRKGRVEEAKATFTTMYATFEKLAGNDVNYAGRASREIGQELMAHESCIDLAIKYFEQAIKNDRDQNEFQYTAGKPLMILLKKQGRKAEARQVLLDGMNPADPGYNDPGYLAYRRVSNAISLGKEFQDLGYPADAIKIYQRVLSSSDDFTQAQRYGGSSQYKQQLQAGLKKSLADLKPESLVELLAPAPKAKAKPNPVNTGRTRNPQPKVEEVAVDPEAVDLILLLDSRELDKTKMSSALGNLIAGMASQPEMLDQAKSALAEVRTKRPDDFGAAILAASIALAAKDEAAKQASVQGLVALAERIPLEAPNDKGTFTTKQRSAAMQQAQLWLIARDCLKHEPLRAAGETLAQRALLAAKRQSDHGYAMAILREWGELALTAGDKPTAERLWGEMLEMVLPTLKPGEKPKKPAKANDGAAAPGFGAIGHPNGSPRTELVVSDIKDTLRVEGRGLRVEGEETLIAISSSREATTANSCGRQPADIVAQSCLSREAATENPAGHHPALTPLRGSVAGSDRDPWADAHGYLLPSLRDSEQTRSPQTLKVRTPHPNPLPSKARGEGTGEEPSLRDFRESQSRERLSYVGESFPRLAFQPARELTRFEQMLAPALVGQLNILSAPLRVAAPAPATKAGGATSLAQFEQAAQIAKLAAENGLTELALKALTKALHGGPPLEAMQEVNSANPFGQPQQMNANSQASIRVQQLLAQLEQTLRQKGVGDDAIYALLRGTVFPESRPLEAFLYTQPLASSPGYQPQSVGALLVRAAVRAKKTDDFKTLCESRLKQPLGELSARVLLGQLALATRDAAATEENLKLLSERLKLDSLQNTSELACHVALPAITLPDAPPIAIELVAQAVDRLHKSIAASRGGGQQEPVTSLTFRLAHHHFAQQKIAEGKRLLDSYLTLQGPMWANYGGDYPAYQRKLAMLKVAGEFARAGMKAESLEMFGRFADATTSRDYQVGGPGKDGSALLNGLASLGAAERYELLSGWSLPTKDRLSVRIITGLITADRTPRAFDAVRGSTPRGPQTAQLNSTLDLLIGAAREADKLDDLVQQLEPHAKANVENASLALAMVHLAKGEGAKAAPLLTELIATRVKEAAATNQNNRRDRRDTAAHDAVLARVALLDNDPAVRELGKSLTNRFIEYTQRVYDQQMMPAMRHASRSALMGPAAAAELDARGIDCGLRHWVAGSNVSAIEQQQTSLPQWWVAHDGVISHTCGMGYDQLYFSYPLTGRFAVECEGIVGMWAEGNIGYDGIVFQGLHGGTNNINIFPAGRRNETVARPDPLERGNNFNRVKIEVDGGAVTYRVNGSPIYTVKKSPGTSPFFMLSTERQWDAVFRNFQITGTPVIPREVALTGGTSLLGWSADFYGETHPRDLPANDQQDENVYYGNEQPVVETAFDWSSVDGEIRGRVLSAASLTSAAPMQSRLYYNRPLRGGESLKYDFWYEPGDGGYVAHPALDRLAFLLDEEGVRVHWMTPSSEPSDNIALPSDNAVVEQAHRRGPARLPLKAGGWNAVQVSLTRGKSNGDKTAAATGGSFEPPVSSKNNDKNTGERGPSPVAPQDESTSETLTITLNGTVVYERPIEQDNSRQFGFYHDKARHAVKVRGVVLSGDWPKSLDPATLANLLEPSRPRTVEERRALANVIDEKYQSLDLDGLMVHARALPPAERYALLLNWVVPNDDHAALRLYGDMSSADLPPLAPAGTAASVVRGEGPGVRGALSSRDASKAKTEDAPHPNPLPAKPGRGDKRMRTAGDLIAPALELVAVAKELGKLPELVAAIEQVPDTTPQLKRSRFAMLVLMSIAANDLETAAAVLKELTPNRSPGLPDDLSLSDRWPELIAAWEASRIPELRPAALALFEVMLDSINRKGIGHEWDVKIRYGRQYLKLAIERKVDVLPLASAVSPKGQWAQGTLIRAQSRAGGIVPRWRFEGNTAHHLGGFGNDLLYFQSPLRGKFTVEADLSTFGWREARAMYGTVWACPQYTHEATDIGNLTTNWLGPKYPTKLDPLGDWYQLKLEVTPDKATYNVSGRVIHETTLGDNCDPWLAIHTFGQYAGEIRSIRITGQPDIPEELLLSKRDDLQGWFGDVYSDTMLVEGAKWRKIGEEIVGQKLANWDRRARESLLQYHRPMLEDGEITYEFYHVPGQTHVHPALGRLAMLLDADGVKVHWLTDAQYERSGLAPDNVSVEQQHRRGPAKLPLKANDWNKLSLKLTGDTVALTLNGEAVFERPVEPTNLRTFGLFHHAGDTDVRVKNVIYRGHWPKSLPLVKEQELNPGPFQLANFKEGELKTLVDWDCSKPKPDSMKPIGATKLNKLEQTPEGMKLVRAANVEKPEEVVGYFWDDALAGDFEVTLSYRAFDSKTTVTDWQLPRLDLVAVIGGNYGTPTQMATISLNARRKHDGGLDFLHGYNQRNGDKFDWSGSAVPTEQTGAKLRIVRKGSALYYLQASDGTDDWQLIQSRDIDKGYVHSVSCTLRTEDLPSSASCVLTGVSIRGQFAGTGPSVTGPNVSELKWNGEGPRPAWLQAWAADAPNKFEPVEGGVKITRPEDPKQKTSPVGFNWNGTLKGDFEVTLGYHDFESKTDKSDYQSPRVEIHIPIGGANDSPQNTHTTTSGHRRAADGKEILTGGVGELQPDGKKAWKTDQAATKRAAGRLRVVRTGSMIHSMTAEAGSDTFVITGSRPASDADVKSMSFTLRSESKASSASIVFTEISIRATGLDSDLAATPKAK